MTTWFTSDQHFGHRNIITYCGRPFADVEEMNAELVRRWNDVVEVGDTVYVLGDFAMGLLGQTLPFARQLTGNKILVPGNHDRCWIGHGGTRKGWIAAYLEAGFDEIRQGTFELDLAGTTVLINHFPYVGDSHDGDRFEKWRPVDEGGWLLHGHIHQKRLLSDRMINVGVDVWEFYPVSEGALADVIAVSNRQRAEDEQSRLSQVMGATEPRL